MVSWCVLAPVPVPDPGGGDAGGGERDGCRSGGRSGGANGLSGMSGRHVCTLLQRREGTGRGRYN